MFEQGLYQKEFSKEYGVNEMTIVNQSGARSIFRLEVLPLGYARSYGPFLFPLAFLLPEW